MDQEEKELGFLVMEALALLLSHNQKNASKSYFPQRHFPHAKYFEIFRNLS